MWTSETEKLSAICHVKALEGFMRINNINAQAIMKAYCTESNPELWL